MKEFSNLITYFVVGIIGLTIAAKNSPPNQTAIAKSDTSKTSQKNPSVEDDEAELDNDSAISILQQNRPLRMTLSVESPSFLKVKVGQQIKQGDVISDNSLERTRLEKQKKSVTLQIDNLKNKAIPKPFEPKQPVGLKQLPPAIFSEEQSAIAQSKLRLTQAQALLEARTP